MANVKFFSEFRSLHGNFYKIEIWDEEYTGNDPVPFKVTGDGFELNYSGQTDNIYSPVIGSSASIGMYIENAQHEAFVDSLKLYQEHRYYIKIHKYTPDEPIDITDEFRQRVETDGGTFEAESCVVDAIDALGGTKDVPFELYAFKWGGYIVQDIVQVEDISNPYVFNLTATDGINKLRNVDAGTGYTTLTNIFANAIFNTYTWNIFPSDWPMLKTISNWWSQQHTYDADENPLETTTIDLNTFHSYDSEGTLQRATYFEVLESVCRIFGIRFYFADGSFRAEQIFQRDDDTFKEFSYQPNGNFISSESRQRDKTINQKSNAARLAGNIYNFLPAVNKTQIVIDRYSVDANGVVHTDALAPEIDLGFIPNDDDNKLIISTNRNVDLVVPTYVQDSTPFYAILDVDVELVGAVSTYYLKRTYSGTTPNAMSWTTTQSGSGLQILIGPFYEDFDQSVSTSGTHTTPPLPVDGTININTSFNKFVRANGTTYTLAGTSSKGFQLEFVNIETSNTDGFSQSTNTIGAQVTNADNESGIVYELGTTKIYDALGARGSLFERDPSTLVQTPTTGWREGNTGAYTKIQNLVTSEFLSLMNSPIQRYQGAIFSAHDFSRRLVFGTLNWLQLGGKFTANNDTWDGEWFAISRETITITDTDTGSNGNPTLRTGSSTRNGSMAFDAIDVADLTADQIETEGDATIGGNVTATDVDASGDISATGNMSAVDVSASGNVSATGNVTATDVDASGDVNATGALTGASAQISGQLDAGDANVVDLSSRNINATGTADIAGDATLESDLEVQGDSTTQGVTTQNGALVHDVTDVTHDDGSNYNITASDYIVFNSWTGGGDNGTGTITLPLATNNEGRLLRFKSDSTIAANKSVQLTTSGSDTIDGAATYTMDRAYDGITILAHNDRWYIIQKKEK